MESTPFYTGIDISKDYFDIAFLAQGSYCHRRFSNDEKGFSAFISFLCGGTHHCVMEASGPYYMKLAFALCAASIAVSVVNPLVIRRFCQMKLTKAKTDKKDAQMIAEYGSSQKPALWQLPREYLIELKQLQAAVFQHIKQHTSLQRQLHAFSYNQCMNALAVESLTQSIAFHKAQVVLLEKEMERLLASSEKDLLPRLEGIPGIGRKTAMLLLVCIGDFSRFENPKQLISYVGLSPRIFESGSSVRGKSRICRMGMGKLRSLLYMCALQASKCNRACKDLYERLVAKGKAKKVALIAVANKLLKQTFAIATKNTAYDKDYSFKTCL